MRCSMNLRKRQLEESASHNEKSPLYEVNSSDKKIKQAIPKTESGFEGTRSIPQKRSLEGEVCNGVGGAKDEIVFLDLTSEEESETTGGSQCGSTSQLSANSPCKTVNQWNEARERQVETATQEAAMETPSSNGPDENPSLPFVKRLPIWRDIESWEVLQKMPQKPHFHPLHSQKELFREGLAIGCMVTFANVVAMTSELKFDDPKSNFDRILRALPGLEMHGFVVKAVRNCLNKLLSLKATQEKLGVMFKGVESQIMERTHQKIQMEEEINELVKMIKDLEEKRALLLSMKKKKNCEVVTSMDVISEAIQNVRHEFESVAAALSN